MLTLAVFSLILGTFVGISIVPIIHLMFSSLDLFISLSLVTYCGEMITSDAFSPRFFIIIVSVTASHIIESKVSYMDYMKSLSFAQHA